MRSMSKKDVALFVSWEASERPYPWTQRQFLEGLKLSTQSHLVWEREKGILGFAVVQLVMSETYILNVMVNPEFRAQGMGTVFMADIEKWALSKGASVIILDVDENNIPAFALYRKCGFMVVQRRMGAYPRGETSLTMRKNL